MPAAVRPAVLSTTTHSLDGYPCVSHFLLIFSFSSFSFSFLALYQLILSLPLLSGNISLPLSPLPFSFLSPSQLAKIYLSHFCSHNSLRRRRKGNFGLNSLSACTTLIQLYKLEPTFFLSLPLIAFFYFFDTNCFYF